MGNNSAILYFWGKFDDSKVTVNFALTDTEKIRNRKKMKALLLKSKELMSFLIFFIDNTADHKPVIARVGNEQSIVIDKEKIR